MSQKRVTALLPDNRNLTVVFRYHSAECPIGRQSTLVNDNDPQYKRGVIAREVAMSANAKNHRLKRRLAVVLLGATAMAAGFFFGEVRAATSASAPQATITHAESNR